jgi:hypothetical protein
MVKFEFTLDDQDAENLMDIIQSEKVRVMAMSLDNPNNASWYSSHADYIENIKQTILAGSSRSI